MPPTAAARIESPLASDVVRRVRDASPLIATVVLTPERDGCAAHVHLDPLLVDARAGQQGLSDRSVAAAAADPRVQRLVAEAVARANAACVGGERIARHEIVARPRYEPATSCTSPACVG